MREMYREQVLWAAEEGADLIISETTFPDGDGFELRRRVRGTTEWSDIPFIFLTAEAAIESVVAVHPAVAWRVGTPVAADHRHSRRCAVARGTNFRPLSSPRRHLTRPVAGLRWPAAPISARSRRLGAA